MEKHLALYLRLSQEDVDVKSNALKDESNSIHSQRLILQKFVEDSPELRGMPVWEFQDDGYTGTSFDRPELQRMLGLVRAGEIGCIVVKDLSRFGRNYLEVGDYLEHIFPFLRVRFIAVNDHYDSSKYIGTTGGIEVAFRNLIYQRYSQDLSEKVKSAMHLKMAKGRYVTHCPYGYMKKPGVKHEMIPDPAAAPIVREIFRSAIDGMKSTEIAAMLNSRNIPTPQQHKGVARGDRHSTPMWSHQAVLRILQDYKYTGAMVNFKCENATVRAKVQRKLDKSQWVIVENSHEPLVTHEEYETANATLRKPKHSKAVRTQRPDAVYYCGHCGRRLRKTFGLDEYYSCATQMYRKDAPCAQIRWSRTDLEKVVLAAYKAHLAVLGEKYKQIQQAPEKDRLQECRKRQKAVSAKLAGIDRRNLDLYEQYRAGSYNKDTFLQRKAELIDEKERLQLELEERQREEERLAQEAVVENSNRQELKEAAESLSYTDEQLREQMYGAINRVIIFDNAELEIEWRYDALAKESKSGYNI
ncbi:recombinase family protein [Acutalibacter muris]|uniref:recombinase family protein n=1 Tax=Acutalibacter muris TaxID=1796620 RepID=UPI001C3EB74F|nr:recombinase family protein [Acutalibacter muris]